jgi:hypothetical protein
MVAASADGQNNTLATLKQRGFVNCGVNSALLLGLDPLKFKGALIARGSQRFSAG